MKFSTLDKMMETVHLELQFLIQIRGGMSIDRQRTRFPGPTTVKSVTSSQGLARLIELACRCFTSDGKSIK